MKFRLVGAACGLCFLAAGVGGAQTFPAGMASPPAAATPDTVTAEVTGPADWPPPAAIGVWPAEPRFGEVAALWFDFPRAVATAGADSLRTAADWLEFTAKPGQGPWWRRWFSKRQEAARLADGAPALASGRFRVVVPVRVYAAGPARIAWRGGPQTDVFPVRGRLGTTKEPAGVRDPRGLGWYVGRILAGLLVLVALAALGLGIRRRWRGGPVAMDRPLPAPAWMAAAIALWRLDQDDLPARGEGREFLDRLAGILRAYLAARFYLPACESTAAELAAAIESSGWPVAPLREFVALIAGADGDRYAPGRIDAPRCRADLARAVALIAAVRVEARYTVVPAALRLDAEAAWGGLARRHLGETAREVAA
jgi:hypothetical protein